MVEVFKTNVEDCDHAIWIVDRIHKMFTAYTANFDLEDCDHILRVKSPGALIDTGAIINIAKYLGFYAEILHDTIIPVEAGRIFNN